METRDPFDLERFVEAQRPVYAAALAELDAGRKQSHWMWFIFPQLKGLGISATALRFGIDSLAEARAYLGHPLLGERLGACTLAVLKHEGKPLRQIFGSPDDMKFRSCMTLFAQAGEGDESLFQEALRRCCGDEVDERTMRLLSEQAR